MPQKTKTVNFFYVETAPEVKFEKVLTEIENEPTIKGDNFYQLSFLSSKGGCKVGVLIKDRTDNIPPKHSSKSKKFSPLPLDDDEGISFGNALIYDPVRKILGLEKNRSAFGIASFELLISDVVSAKKGLSPLSISFKPILTKDAYSQIMGMKDFKTVTFEIAMPSELIPALTSKVSPVYAAAQLANDFKSTKLKVELSATGSYTGLDSSIVKKLVTAFNSLRKQENQNVRNVVVKGGLQDEESVDLKYDTIKLFADTIEGEFELESVRLHQDLQVDERKSGIYQAYTSLLSTFDALDPK